jgi:hypothetical protein
MQSPESVRRTARAGGGGRVAARGVRVCARIFGVARRGEVQESGIDYGIAEEIKSAVQADVGFVQVRECFLITPEGELLMRDFTIEMSQLLLLQEMTPPTDMRCRRDAVPHRRLIDCIHTPLGCAWLSSQLPCHEAVHRQRRVYNNPSHRATSSSSHTMSYLKLGAERLLCRVHHLIDLSCDCELVGQRLAEEDASRRNDGGFLKGGARGVDEEVGSLAEGYGGETALGGEEPGGEGVWRRHGGGLWEVVVEGRFGFVGCGWLRCLVRD